MNNLNSTFQLTVFFHENTTEDIRNSIEKQLELTYYDDDLCFCIHAYGKNFITGFNLNSNNVFTFFAIEDKAINALKPFEKHIVKIIIKAKNDEIDNELEKEKAYFPLSEREITLKNTDNEAFIKKMIEHKFEIAFDDNIFLIEDTGSDWLIHLRKDLEIQQKSPKSVGGFATRLVISKNKDYAFLTKLNSNAGYYRVLVLETPKSLIPSARFLAEYLGVTSILALEELKAKDLKIIFLYNPDEFKNNLENLGLKIEIKRLANHQDLI